MTITKIALGVFLGNIAAVFAVELLAKLGNEFGAFNVAGAALVLLVGLGILIYFSQKKAI